MSGRKSIPVSLPVELVAELDRLVEEGEFQSRSEALQHGARLVVHHEATDHLHDRTLQKGHNQVRERLDRKR